MPFAAGQYTKENLDQLVLEAQSPDSNVRLAAVQAARYAYFFRFLFEHC